MLNSFPNDPETWALLGRVDKDAWVASWRQAERTPEQMREDAAYEDALLRTAIESYAAGYRRNPAHYYSGINALTLMHLHGYLTNDSRYEREMASMAGAVRFAAECESDGSKAFWSKATLGDLEVLLGSAESAREAIKDAIAKNDHNWFDLNSCRAQLHLLQDLGFRPATVDAGLATFNRALQNLKKPQDRWQPRKVFLFSGHMVDAPNRQPPRFPDKPEKLAAAAQRIADALAQFDAGPDDLAVTQGACGGDLLFTEACQERGVNVQWLQPFPEPEFIEKSVVSRGESWRTRYLAAKAKLTRAIRSAPEELGLPPKGTDFYQRSNLWLLYTALSYGIGKVQFICLWNGEAGDGTGGTAHMYEEVKRRTGQVTWIDSRKI